MGFFDKFKKKKPQDHPAPAPSQSPAQPAEPQFFEESGGVSKAEAVRQFQGLHLAPDTPIGVAGGGNDYGGFAGPDALVVFFNGDNEHPMRIEKSEFMTVKDIVADTRFYMQAGKPDAALSCAIQGLHKKEMDWQLYELAATLFWRFRYIENANALFLAAWRCEDCPCKAHMLCQAAATFCIMRKPDEGLAYYMKALEEEPNNPEVFHDLGGFYWDNGDLEKAADYYFQALATDPCYFASYEELSNLFKQLGSTNWVQPFMASFQDKKSLPAEQLRAAQADMKKLLEGSHGSK